ncbi:uncharacterized protein LACBIDRAFT_329128 [Laccaria bicolor S238N-H82]|uniref:Predicted protein n=1 Tax=Laccaria bicolor (strain S238N-H82 / ATCC MYA-4686) TaxID=486041 RepID=B0DH57_LACBS|nr:uncharacterized protein LACBIDRAFT_329128 [Laccaria bicolor S238N-H82]EDR05957.1 predicted protein [Laccaria bicolor S238N-H82]|eukprot:XP_001883245.1 predicted protein [Laccaria bicolor S238N-H82]
MADIFIVHQFENLLRLRSDSECHILMGFLSHILKHVRVCVTAKGLGQDTPPVWGGQRQTTPKVFWRHFVRRGRRPENSGAHDKPQASQIVTLPRDLQSMPKHCIKMWHSESERSLINVFGMHNSFIILNLSTIMEVPLPRSNIGPCLKSSLKESS